MDISPKAQNKQDTIHRPHEAQEGGKPKCGWVIWFFSEREQNTQQENLWRQSVGQRLKERPSIECPT